MGELLYTIDSIKTFKKDLRRHAGMTGIWFVMYFIIMTVGAVLFFYIEQCYNQKARSNIDLTEQLRGDMCRIASSMRLFNGSYNQNSLSDNVSLLLNASLRFCEQPSNKKTILRCEWTAGMFSKWLFYCSSVGFTIGNNNCSFRLMWLDYYLQPKFRIFHKLLQSFKYQIFIA